MLCLPTQTFPAFIWQHGQIQLMPLPNCWTQYQKNHWSPKRSISQSRVWTQYCTPKEEVLKYFLCLINGDLSSFPIRQHLQPVSISMLSERQCILPKQHPNFCLRVLPPSPAYSSTVNLSLVLIRLIGKWCEPMAIHPFCLLAIKMIFLVSNTWQKVSEHQGLPYDPPFLNLSFWHNCLLHFSPMWFSMTQGTTLPVLFP